MVYDSAVCYHMLYCSLYALALASCRRLPDGVGTNYMIYYNILRYSTYKDKHTITY